MGNCQNNKNKFIVKTILYNSGRIYMIISCLNDLPEGPCAKFYETGNLWENYTYRNGLRNGPFISFSETGKIHEIGSYKNGVPVDDFQV